MKFLTYLEAGRPRLALKRPAGIVDVATLGEWAPQSIEQLLDAGQDVMERISLASTAAQPRTHRNLQLGPCVPNPGKIVCVGRNYAGHAAEIGEPVPETPLLFSKFHNSVAAAGEPIALPRNSHQVDYEAELAVVMGRRAQDVPEQSALDFVFGYCNANDLSARDLQFLTSQWLLGKSWDRAFPIGPWLVTAEEVGNPQELDIKCWVNRELRQDDTTASMIFSVAQLVSYVSHYMTLDPGDIISTGTPEGVVLGSPSKGWLKPGDEVTVEVQKLGRLTNKLT
jgi:2-keto-4-pentenoate hydratase/2-oxohepta-3-ene-1,7-dioic acid hydratase in catechol pathway